MTVKKQFAQDGGDLDASMDQLVEVLAQLLDDAACPQNQDPAPAIEDLHSGNVRGIHVIEEQPER
jgi:hypothetical protein